MSVNHNEIERGFYKQAVDMGVEPEFLDGYFKVARDMSDAWQEKIAQVEKETGDPLYRQKLAAELCDAIDKSRIQKSAEFKKKKTLDMSLPQRLTMAGVGGVGAASMFYKYLHPKTEGATSPVVDDDLMSKAAFELPSMDSLNTGTHDLMKSVGGMFGQSEGVGGAVVGGGGGLLVGFMLHKMLGIPLPLALLLGGLGGGALGGAFGAGKIGQPSNGADTANSNGHDNPHVPVPDKRVADSSSLPQAASQVAAAPVPKPGEVVAPESVISDGQKISGMPVNPPVIAAADTKPTTKPSDSLGKPPEITNPVAPQVAAAPMKVKSQSSPFSSMTGIGGSANKLG